jgi:hypothetical protein
VTLSDGPASVRGLGGDVEVGIFSGQVGYGVGFDLPSGRAGLTFGPRTALPGATGLDLSQVALIDLDGDARPELVRLVDDSWRY